MCGQLETRLRYSHTLAWNTFPVPTLTEKNKGDLTRCAEDILLAREAHERNDEVLERIYVGRRFRNDTERLEKLFELYTKMTAGQPPASPARSRRKGGGGGHGLTADGPEVLSLV